MLSEGIPFETIEDRINASPVSQEMKGVLWLWAWSKQPPEDQRRRLAELVEQLP